MIIPEGETTAPSIYAFKFGSKNARNLPLYLDKPYDEINLDRQNPHWQGPFKNVRNGTMIMLRSADCGLGCHCAAEWKLAGKSIKQNPVVKTPLDLKALRQYIRAFHKCYSCNVDVITEIDYQHGTIIGKEHYTNLKCPVCQRPMELT